MQVRFFLTRNVEIEVFPCRSSEARHSGASVGRLQPFLIRVRKGGHSYGKCQEAAQVYVS